MCLSANIRIWNMVSTTFSLSREQSYSPLGFSVSAFTFILDIHIPSRLYYACSDCMLQGGCYPHVYVDGICLRRNWGGEFENVAILVAIAVNGDGHREVMGVAEGMNEDKAGWVSLFQ